MANHRDSLLQLTYIRTVTLFGQGLAVLFALYGLKADLNVWLIGLSLLFLALLNLMTYSRLHSPWPVTEPEFFSQLLAEMVLYAAVLYQMGGATNPFIFLLLIPLIIAAATLSRVYVWCVSVTVVVIYSLLLSHYQPLVVFSDNHQHRIMALFDLHVFGMWLNFLLTVLVVTYFIVRMRLAMQAQQQELEMERERRIQDQQLLSLATMAAGTAHELGTPLSTMSVLLQELQHEHAANPELQEDLQLLQQQSEICSQRLQQLTQSVQQEQASSLCMPVTDLVSEVLEQWSLQRPELSHMRYSVIGQAPAPQLRCTVSLKQSLLNLLNNAADANSEGIDVSLDWTEQYCLLQIHDQGSGISLEQSQYLGKPFITTKGKGLGIGLFLTATTLARHDGDVRLYNHPRGGTLTEVTLPVKADA
ncbi:sensor histidine kinase [Pontibacter sp. JAM-7]|uniref:sensor histidine kinase n=1 Tax=Pontibacter sp. JAM-7 TaxID=3366581 RepID=UPI003AF734BA